MSCDCDDQTINTVESTSVIETNHEAALQVAPSRICRKCFFTWIIILIIVILICKKRKE